jgi:hypothetical protein
MTDVEPPEDSPVRSLLEEVERSIPVDAAARARTEVAAMAAFEEALDAAGSEVLLVDAGELDLAPASEVPVTSRRRRTMLIAAAAAVLAVVGLAAVLSDGGDRLRTGEDSIIGDRPEITPTVVDLPTLVDWETWSAATPAEDVTRCLARATGDQVAVRDLPAANADIPGFAPEAWLLSQFRPLEVLVDRLDEMRSPGAARSDAARAQADAFAAAELAQFGPDGTPTAGFPELVAAYLDARTANPANLPDPSGCWLDRPAAVEAIDALAAEAGDIQLVRCLVGEMLESTLRVQQDEPEVDYVELIRQAALALTAYPDGDATEITELVTDLLAGAGEPESVRVERLEAGIQRLQDFGLGLDTEACPLAARA